MTGRRGNAHYATDACRTRAWKDRTGYVDRRGRKPSRNARPRGHRPSDLRVSYSRLVEVLGETVARELLTPRQRARLRR